MQDRPRRTIRFCSTIIVVLSFAKLLVREEKWSDSIQCRSGCKECHWNSVWWAVTWTIKFNHYSEVKLVKKGGGPLHGHGLLGSRIRYTDHLIATVIFLMIPRGWVNVLVYASFRNIKRILCSLVMVRTRRWWCMLIWSLYTQYFDISVIVRNYWTV